MAAKQTITMKDLQYALEMSRKLNAAVSKILAAPGNSPKFNLPKNPGRILGCPMNRLAGDLGRCRARKPPHHKK